MPTGYTARVCDGKITEFPAFALQCARAFGALITMRDDSSDAPIPDEIKPSTWNADRYAETKARLAELESMSPEQSEVAAFQDYERRGAEVMRWNRERDEQNDRLTAMLENVKAWQPPTPDHAELKKFMAEQITISLSDYKTEMPAKLSGTAWLAAQIAQAQRSLEYHATEQAKENERATRRTAWLQSLRASLAP